MLSEYGPIEAAVRDQQVPQVERCIPCSQSTAPLKQGGFDILLEHFDVFRALRVRPH